jgi:predicted heme/steroid binding protein
MMSPGNASNGPDTIEKEGLVEERVFTVEELASFDGKDGRPAYVAFKGKVYDVSDSAMWDTGEHEDEHSAGRDLTDDLDFAPHDDYVFDNVPMVGALAT